MKSFPSSEANDLPLRDAVLQQAGMLACDRGLALLTIENVARACCVRTTDVRRYFWHRHDLVVAVFKALLDRLQDRMADAANRDPIMHGRAVRAYLTLLTDLSGPREDIRLLMAFTVAMTQDRSISVVWHTWLAAQFDGIADPIDPDTLELVCLAVDGLRLQEATQGGGSATRQAVLQRLTRMTCPPCEQLQAATS
jgi:AcrR family transcriptional regulator